jgi:hypothetical protein
MPQELATYAVIPRIIALLKPMANSRAYIPKWVITIDKCDT